VAAALLAATLASCQPTPDIPFADPGEPLPGLSPAQLARFQAGRALFDRDVSAEEGLGPTFNQRRCSSCHDLPTVGGSGVERVLRATRWAEGRCDPLTDAGGDNVQPRVTERYRAMGGTGESIPLGTSHTIDMVAPALYGIGLIEAIPDSAILSRADPDDADGDGISGRAGRTSGGDLARFGQKATEATLREFVEGALLQEMGITTPGRPGELSVNGSPTPPDADPAPDPEFGEAEVELLLDYLRLLAPPAPLARDSAGAGVDEGRQAFLDLGCGECHIESLRTALDAPAPLGGVRVPLYSDLLLHDMGHEAEGICSPSASPREVRTAPLMGLRLRPLLTHHGRASTLPDVIRHHGGEAGASAQAFAELSPERQRLLLRFLGTL
jgi:CxxC motif-containing protein (DUF1111 family)